MNDRDIPVYLSPDHILALDAALAFMQETGCGRPYWPYTDAAWLREYLMEHRAGHLAALPREIRGEYEEARDA